MPDSAAPAAVPLLADRTRADRPASNVLELTVGELSGALKRAIEDRFGFVRVRGEISNYRGPHSSGHAYFSLKDDTARIDAVVWRTAFQRLKTKPQDGLEVLATGRVTTFPGKSAYQIVIETLEPAGVGALMALLDARRKALAAEGLFDATRKTALPFLPRVVGVVTSPTGAVIRDILHRLEDRFPRRVLVWPVRVQGETAADEVADAIAGFNALPVDGPVPRPDVLIVARGGGSLEDLWAFNEEAVVRAVAAGAIPLISAIGHETDVTLIDHAADLRAPTPSGAAEKAVPVRSDLLAICGDLGRRHEGAVRRLLDRRRQEARAFARAMPAAETVIAVPRQKLDRAEERLASAVAGAAGRRHLDLARLAHRLSRQAPLTRLAGQRSALDGLEQRLAFLVERARERRAQQLGQGGQRLARLRETLLQDVARRREQETRLAAELAAAAGGGLAMRRERVVQAGKLLETLGYRQVLARGYALVRNGRGVPLRSARDAAHETSLDIEFADGHIAVNGSAPRRPRGPVKVEQGSLF